MKFKPNLPYRYLTNPLVILLPALLALSSCSTVYDNTIGLFEDEKRTHIDSGRIEPRRERQAVRSAEPAQTTSVAITELDQASADKDQAPAGKTDEVEILWEIPKEAVDGFVLKYGYSENSLEQEKRLTLKEIEKFDDPNFGFVYRYVLKNVPKRTTLYVRLATTQNDSQSEFSEVFTVEPSRE